MLEEVPVEALQRERRARMVAAAVGTAAGVRLDLPVLGQMVRGLLMNRHLHIHMCCSAVGRVEREAGLVEA